MGFTERFCRLNMQLAAGYFSRWIYLEPAARLRFPGGDHIFIRFFRQIKVLMKFSLGCGAMLFNITVE